MILSLPYPAKALWPNGRAHWASKCRETRKHKAWAHTAALAERHAAPTGDRLQLVVTIRPKTYGPYPDADNAIASLKAYQDGIAAALGVDDRHFAQPEVTFGPRTNGGRFSVEVRSL